MKYIKYSWEELEVLKNASVPITKQDTTDVLFGFAHLNAGCDMRGRQRCISSVLRSMLLC